MEYGKSDGEISFPDTISKEFLIFNFNILENQNNTIWFECRVLKNKEIFPTILFPLECNPYKTDYVNIDSEECKQIYYEFDYFEALENMYNYEDASSYYTEHDLYNNFIKLSIIEGIGPVGNGMLYGPCFFTCKWGAYDEYGPVLNRVYNKEGEIIFRGLDKNWTTLQVTGLLPDNNTITFSNNSILVSEIANSTLTITDTSGRQVLQRTVQGGDRVDVSELPAGIYIATLSNGSAVKICLN